MLKVDRNKISRVMQLSFVTAADLSRLSGVSPTSISKLMAGKTTPRPATLKKICEALKCEPSDILEEVEE